MTYGYETAACTSFCVLGDVVLTAGRLASNYLPASGQALSAAAYGTLIEVIQSAYGGDGVSSFNLPDLRAASPNGLTYETCVSGNRPNVVPALPPPGTATTTMVVWSVANNVLNFGAKVTASTGTAVPTGTVIITDQAYGIQACGILQAGPGITGCSLSAPRLGSYTYVATYSGDATLLGSTSVPQTVIIF